MQTGPVETAQSPSSSDRAGDGVRPTAHDPGCCTETWTARDGAALTLRPVLPEDTDREEAFIDALSRETSYRRLLSPRRPTHAEVERFTHIDYDREFALVAIDESGPEPVMVGVTRYVRDGDRAEWAIVLADAWQARGLGRRLLGNLIDAARKAGVRELSDVTFATNDPMLKLARSLGFRITREVGDATLDRMTLVL